MKAAPYLLSMLVCIHYVFAQVEQRPPYQHSLINQPEAVSLFGKPLNRIDFPANTKVQLDSHYVTALGKYEENPDDADNIIWLGRRAAYLWRYQEAIRIFTEGIRKYPDDPRMYRHRGHRFITVREFDKAIADLEKAASLIKNRADEIELDGQPNRYNIPTSTLNSNIWYHLGLVYYLKADFQNALRCFTECKKFSNNADMLCATSDWLYMIERRLGKLTEAKAVLTPITQKMKILENFAYHRRLLMYKGELPIDSLLNLQKASDLDIATYGYGVGNWHLYNGRLEEAKKIFEQVLAGNYWAAFGYIAAEADLKRTQKQ
ncbi:MAG TPA: hypothetical protein VII11_00075 [Bacteroidota bacterium]